MYKLHYVVIIFILSCGFFSVDSKEKKEKMGYLYYKTHCSSCHALSEVKTAPPMRAIARVYKMHTSSKKEFVQRVVQWVRKPRKEDSLLCHCIIARFGLMPALPLPRKKLERIALWMWEIGGSSHHHGGMMGGMGGMMGGRGMCGGGMMGMCR